MGASARVSEIVDASWGDEKTSGSLILISGVDMDLRLPPFEGVVMLVNDVSDPMLRENAPELLPCP